MCYEKIALPNELEGLTDRERAVIALPRLPLLNGSVMIEALGAALGVNICLQKYAMADTTFTVSA